MALNLGPSFGSFTARGMSNRYRSKRQFVPQAQTNTNINTTNTNTSIGTGTTGTGTTSTTGTGTQQISNQQIDLGPLDPNWDPNKIAKPANWDPKHISAITKIGGQDYAVLGNATTSATNVHDLGDKFNIASNDPRFGFAAALFNPNATENDRLNAMRAITQFKF